MEKYSSNSPQQEPAPTVAPTIAPPQTTPTRKGDPSRIPYKRPEADPRSKA